MSSQTRPSSSLLHLWSSRGILAGLTIFAMSAAFSVCAFLPPRYTGIAILHGDDPADALRTSGLAADVLRRARLKNVLPPTADKLLKNLEIRSGNNAQLTVRYTDETPEGAALYANLFASAYLENRESERMAAIQQRIDRLSVRMTAARQAYLEAEQAIAAHMAEHALFEHVPPDLASRAGLRLQLAAFLERKAMLENEFPALPSSLNAERDEAKQRLETLSIRYGPRHPKIIEARAALQALDSRLQKDRMQKLNTLQAELDAISAQIENLNAALAEDADWKQVRQKAMIRLHELEFEAAIRKSAFDAFVQAYVRTVTHEAHTEENPLPLLIRSAQEPDSPSWPKTPVAVFVSGLCAFAFACLWVLLSGPRRRFAPCRERNAGS